MLLSKLLLKYLPSASAVNYYLGQGAGVSYARWQAELKTRIANWHRKELRKFDAAFDAREEADQLMQRRREAEARGIGPLDARYPDILDGHHIP